MRLTRIYTNQAITLHSNIKLDEAASLHVARVLRLKKDDKLIIFNGYEIGEYQVTIATVNKQHVVVVPEKFYASRTRISVKNSFRASYFSW
jgi:16S rRNA (uracil1498-N3)-methyltransferase